MKRQKTHGGVIKILVPVIICLIAALVTACYFLFRVNTITYEGNRHYSDEEMNTYIFGTNTPNAVIYNIFGKKNRQIPFIQKYDVETVWPDKMNVIIYEKAIVGYINYMGCNMYFDKDGIVVESTSKTYSGVPQIEGLKFTSIVLGSKLETGNDSVFSDILELTQAFEKYKLNIDKVYFDSSYDVTLYMNDVKIILGNPADSTDRLYALKRMENKISSLKGTLYLSDYNGSDSSVIFKKEN